ncbi:MAG: helix-turn-helix domain-containing protein [Ignavibacteriaceae bacterium]|nr:helix-turn-helix domain-containing protein [Ignavibacteriaceae bacterium]
MKLEQRKKEKEIIIKGLNEMSDLKKYVARRKNEDAEFAENYDIGYQNFKIGVLLKGLRVKSGLTQEELADKLQTKKSVISRIENHAEDIKLSTLRRYAKSLGRRIKIEVV